MDALTMATQPQPQPQPQTQHGYDSAADALAREPTRTVTVRKRYAQSLRGTLDRLRAALRDGIVEQDAFGLEAAREQLARYRGLPVDALNTIDPPDGWDFPKRVEKEQAFRTWLDRQVNRRILDPNRSGNDHLQETYTRGLRQADRDLKRAGWIDDTTTPPKAMVRRRVHQNALQAVFARNYRQLEGFSSWLGTETSRVLSEGLAAGDDRRSLASDLADVIGSGGPSGTTGGEARVTRIARTEVMNSWHEATFTRYDEVGVERATVALSPAACSRCQALKAAAPFELDALRSRLPAHPNCRCAARPLPAR